MFEIIKLGTNVLQRIINPSISKINLALTFQCNHKCITCNIWKTKGNKLTENSKYKDELSVDEIEKIVTRNNLLYVSLTGGEPFLRKDIKEILLVCLKHVPMVTLTSNGSQPTLIVNTVREVVAKNKNIFDINISLDGNEEQHDAFTRTKDSYKKAKETIERLVIVSKDYKNLKLTIETLVSEQTNKGHNNTIQFAKELGIEITYSIIQKAIFYDNEDNKIGVGELPKIHLRPNIHSIFSYLYLRTAKKNNIPDCVAGQYTCSVTPFGDVMPCLFVPIIFKNLRDTNYIIGKLDYKNIISKCKEKCWTPCEAYPTIMFRPWRLL